MICTVCIIQKRKAIFQKFLIYFPEKDQDLSILITNLIKLTEEYRTSINFQPFPLPGTLFSPIRLTPSLPSSFPLKYHLI